MKGAKPSVNVGMPGNSTESGGRRGGGWWNEGKGEGESRNWDKEQRSSVKKTFGDFLPALWIEL